MLRKTVILASLIIIVLGGASTLFAQGFPWNDFKPRTLKEIVSIDAKEIKESERVNRVVLHADMLLSVVRVKYTGKTRPMSDIKKDLLLKWSQTFAPDDPDYASHYEMDALFTENGVEYWLPVQKKVMPYFAKELKVDDYVDLYIVRAGGICSKQVCDWMFLVEEFQKPKVGATN